MRWGRDHVRRLAHSPRPSPPQMGQRGSRRGGIGGISLLRLDAYFTIWPEKGIGFSAILPSAQSPYTGATVPAIVACILPLPW
jgi:hypothetical protein